MAVTFFSKKYQGLINYLANLVTSLALTFNLLYELSSSKCWWFSGDNKILHGHMWHSKDFDSVSQLIEEFISPEHFPLDLKVLHSIERWSLGHQ